MNHDYANRKLKLLLRELGNYNAGEFFREMSRITEGATGIGSWEALAAQNERLRECLMECSVKFQQYAEHHKAKGADGKASTNKMLAMAAKSAAELPGSVCLGDIKEAAMKQGYYQGFAEGNALDFEPSIDAHWRLYLDSKTKQTKNVVTNSFIAKAEPQQ